MEPTLFKNPAAVDQSLHFYGLQLLDLPSLGAHEVLVVPVKEDREVRELVAHAPLPMRINPSAQLHFCSV